jgi:hypothetical protein
MDFKPLRNLHKNQSGEMPIGPILIIALVVLPLIFMLITFRDSAEESLADESDAVFGQGTDKTTISK